MRTELGQVVMAPNQNEVSKAPRVPSSEDDLRENFVKYRELVEELTRRFPIPVEAAPAAPDRQSSEYVFEPIFFYQVHARS